MQTTRKEQIEKAIELLESQIASIKEDLENFDPSDYSAESDY